MRRWDGGCFPHYSCPIQAAWEPRGPGHTHGFFTNPLSSMHPWLWDLATQPQKQEASQWLCRSFSNISQAQYLPQAFIHPLFSHHRHGSILALLGLSTMKPGPRLPSKQSWVMRSLPSATLTLSQACARSCLTLCNPLDCSPRGSCGCGISQARILERVPFPAPGNLPDPGIKPTSPTLADRFCHLGNPSRKIVCINTLLQDSWLSCYLLHVERKVVSIEK